ncbi:MAG TPA: serine/threonine-protein kinase [Candidatus Cloacimonadota bacterium]|nr:serine/threonine-protein kinase [Candidatus Cloacimonadota bacterium]
MQLHEGLIVRDYRLLRQIGEGGMGQVWLAEDINIERKIALKILSARLSADAELVERFRQEAKLQSHLTHPNIVSLHGFFPFEGTYSIVLEYAPGISLKQLIATIGPIPFARALKILGQILDGLEYTHNKGIIHRDIKPSNIMVDIEHGDSVKIMDFGIAKALGDLSNTNTGAQIGTLYYMSPEQITDSKSIDHRSDIYSLGVLLFEMLTGQKPYDISTENAFKIQSQIVYDEIPDPTTIYPHIPQWLVSILYQMCAKNREERYQSINEIRADIRRMSPPVRPEPVINLKHEAAPKPAPKLDPPPQEKSSLKRLFIWAVVIIILIVGYQVVKGFLFTGRDSEAADSLQVESPEANYPRHSQEDNAEPEATDSLKTKTETQPSAQPAQPAPADTL